MAVIDEAAAPPAGTRLDGIRSLRHVLVGWRAWYGIALLWNAIGHLAGAAATGAAAYAVASAITRTGTDLLVPTLLVAGATILRSVAVWQETYVSHDVAFRVLARVRGWVFRALARIAPAGVTNRRTGDLTTTSTNDSEALEIFLAHSSLYIIGRVLATPLIVLGLAVISVPAAAVTIPFLALAWLTPLVARRAAVVHGRQARHALAELGADMQENVGAVREITAFGLLPHRLERLTQLSRRLWRAQRATSIRTGIESAVGGVVSALIVVVATIVAAAQVRSGTLDIAWLPVVASVAGATPSAIAQWAAVTRHYGNTAAAARRVEALLDAPDPLPVIESDEPDTDPPSGALPLELENVTFRWQDAPSPAVAEISLSVPAGQTIAIAGASGAGKSTLAQLIARWYDPQAGRVRIGGRDLRTVARDDLPDLVCLVPQDTFLFAESIRENLALAAQAEVSEDRLWAALDRSRASDLVRRLPHGLDTVLADHGRSLSGGERQRLALARLALRNPSVVVLDEAVSQLDVANEEAVQSSFEDTDQTTVIIAHRLVTLLRAERIVVLDRGRVVGDGTHPDLLAGCEAYRRLVLPQMTLDRSEQH